MDLNYDTKDSYNRCDSMIATTLYYGLLFQFIYILKEEDLVCFIEKCFISHLSFNILFFLLKYWEQNFVGKLWKNFQSNPLGGNSIFYHIWWKMHIYTLGYCCVLSTDITICKKCIWKVCICYTLYKMLYIIVLDLIVN